MSPAPASPGTPRTPGSPGTPRTPGSPGTPRTPGSPGTPRTPGSPGTPRTPGSPETPRIPGRLDEMVTATPATRDRYVDFLRAASIVVVVLGHWTISIIAWDGGIIRSTSALGPAPGLWLATWVFQVMPVFFFVGGYANLVAYESARRRGDSAGAFIRSRLRRLLLPSLVLLGVWAVVQVVLHLTGTGTPTGPRIGGPRPAPGRAAPGPDDPLRATVVPRACTSWWFASARSRSPCTAASAAGWSAVMAAGAVVCDLVGFVGRPGRRALPQCGLRPAAPPPARPLLRRRAASRPGRAAGWWPWSSPGWAGSSSSPTRGCSVWPAPTTGSGGSPVSATTPAACSAPT